MVENKECKQLRDLHSNIHEACGQDLVFAEGKCLGLDK